MNKAPLVWKALILLLFTLFTGTLDASDVPKTSESEIITLESLKLQIQDLSRLVLSLQLQVENLERSQQAAEHKDQETSLVAAAKAAVGSDPEEPNITFESRGATLSQFNPEISVTGNLFYLGGDDELERASIGEWEFNFRSNLDPYTSMQVLLAKAEGEELEIEEGYLSWNHLPGGLSLSAGKKRQQFGVINRRHAHARDQADAPWILEESFGDEGLVGTGIFFDWLLPGLGADASGLTLELTNGDNEVAFGGEDWSRPTVLGRYKSYWDLSSQSYLEIGLNALHGSVGEEQRLDHHFLGLDFSFNHSPAGLEKYHEFTLRGLAILSRLEHEDHRTQESWGGFLYGEYRFSRQWIAGLRYDRVDDQLHEDRHLWGLSPYLTFWQSEYVRLRAQASFRDDSESGIERRFFLQLTLAAGPHKHESY